MRDGDDRWSIQSLGLKKANHFTHPCVGCLFWSKKEKRLSFAFFLFSIALTATHHNETYVFWKRKKKRKLLITKLPWE